MSFLEDFVNACRDALSPIFDSNTGTASPLMPTPKKEEPKMPEPVQNPEVEFMKKRMPDSVRSDLKRYNVPIDPLLQMSVVEIYEAFQRRILAYYHDENAHRSASNVLGYLFTMDCFLKYRTPLDVVAIEQIFPDLATTAVAALRNYCISAPNVNPNLEGLKRVFGLGNTRLSNQYSQRKAAQDERERRLAELENKVNAQLKAIEKLNGDMQSAVRRVENRERYTEQEIAYCNEVRERILEALADAPPELIADIGDRIDAIAIRPPDPLDIGSDPILDKPVETLDLIGFRAPGRIYRAMLIKDIRTIRDLTKCTRRELLAIRNIGPSCVDAIERALDCYNLKLTP